MKFCAITCFALLVMLAVSIQHGRVLGLQRVIKFSSVLSKLLRNQNKTSWQTKDLMENLCTRTKIFDLSKARVTHCLNYLEKALTQKYDIVYAAQYMDPNSQAEGNEGKRPAVQRLACKVINGSIAPTEFVDKFLPRELSIITKLDHKNIIRTHSIIYMSDLRKWFVFMQLGDNGDLLRFLLEYGPLRERRARMVFTQLLSAIEYLQSKHITHRDIKCENILLTRAYNIKLSDFGFARYVDKNADTDEYIKSTTFCGSLQYAAPEIIRGKEYNPFKVDIWSMGVLLYIVLNKALPFEDGSRKAIYVSQMKKQWTWRKAITDSISNRLKQFLPRLLQPQPDRRADIEELQSHPWLKADISSKSSHDTESVSAMTLKAIPSVQDNSFFPISSKILEFDGKAALNIAMPKDVKLSLPDDYRHSVAHPETDAQSDNPDTRQTGVNNSGKSTPKVPGSAPGTPGTMTPIPVPNVVKTQTVLKDKKIPPEKKK